MLPPPKEIIAFLDGRRGKQFIIGHTPSGVSGRIKARTNSVFLGLDYAKKIKTKHNMGYNDFKLIQTSMCDGYCAIHRGDLLFIFQTDGLGKNGYKLVVKSAKMGEELWLKTFHRCDKLQMRSLLKRSELLIEHK